MWAGLGHPEVTAGGQLHQGGTTCRLPFKPLNCLPIGGFHIEVLISGSSRGQSEIYGLLNPLCRPHTRVPLHHSPSWLPCRVGRRGAGTLRHLPPYIINHFSATS